SLPCGNVKSAGGFTWAAAEHRRRRVLATPTSDEIERPRHTVNLSFPRVEPVPTPSLLASSVGSSDGAGGRAQIPRVYGSGDDKSLAREEAVQSAPGAKILAISSSEADSCQATGAARSGPPSPAA